MTGSCHAADFLFIAEARYPDPVFVRWLCDGKDRLLQNTADACD